MKKALFALLVCLVGITLFYGYTVSAQVAGAPSPAVQQAPPPPKSFAAAKGDLSAPLRSLPVAAPAQKSSVVTRDLPRLSPSTDAARAGALAPQVADPVVQRSLGPNTMPEPIENFEGISNEANLPWKFVPPDTTGDVGLDHYIQWVNTVFAIYDKTGRTLYGPVNGNTLWAGFGGECETGNWGDPIVLYDRYADRWLFSQFSLGSSGNGPFHQCIALSQTRDPLGAYYRWAYNVSDLGLAPSMMNDYPKFGVWRDSYAMTVVLFDELTGYTYAGPSLAMFDRNAMLAGNRNPAGKQYSGAQYSMGPNAPIFLPAHSDGPLPPPPGAPGYFVAAASPTSLSMYRVYVDWAADTSRIEGPIFVPVAAYDWEVCPGTDMKCIPQPGTTQKVDSLSDRLMFRLNYRNFGTYEALVVNHTVDADNVTGDGKAGIRWYELRNPGGTPTVYQQGTFAPDATHRWMGSIAMNGAGDIALGYSVSDGTSTYPGIRYTGRRATDPLGLLPQGEATVIAGSGSQTTSTGRWGDYSTMSVDPRDDCTFWYTQEYYTTTSDRDWRTRISSFRFPNCPSLALGVLRGAVKNSADMSPLANVKIVAGDYSTETDASGQFSMTVPAGTYTVTAAAWGFLSESQQGTVTNDGVSTLPDFTLDPLPTTAVEGTVTDTPGGWPLPAIVGIAGDPRGPVANDPVTGFYRIVVPQGHTFALKVSSLVPSYAPAERMVTVGTSTQTENFALPGSCASPGYFDAGASFLTQSFDAATTPAGWSVIDNLGVGGLNVWRFDNPGGRLNYTGGSGNFAIVDSDQAGSGSSQDTELRTPVVNLSGQPEVLLRFKSDFYAYSDEIADVDVSVNGAAGPWTNVWRQTESRRGPITETIDISAIAAGQANVMVRFHYYNAAWEWYWQVDDVRLLSENCAPGSGGLVVGQVIDMNTRAPLAGAKVANDAGLVSFSAPAAGAVPAGFYALWSPVGTRAITATHEFGYRPAYAYPTVTAGANVQQLLELPAGRLSVDRPAYQLTLDPGASASRTLTITNNGPVTAAFAIAEVNGAIVDAPAGSVAQAAGWRWRIADPGARQAGTSRYYDAQPTAVIAAGQVISSWSGPYAAWGIGADVSTGDIWVGDTSGTYGNDLDHRYRPDGTVTGDTIDAHFAGGWGADLAYNPLTKKLWQVSAHGLSENYAPTQNGTCIYELDPVAKVQTGRIICPSLDTSQRGLAYDDRSDTFYSGSWNDGVINRFDTSGRLIESRFVDLAVSGLAFNPRTRHLFVMTNHAITDTLHDIYVLDAANNLAMLGAFDVFDSAGPVFSGNDQAGLDMDCEGKLWAVNQYTGKVLRLETGEPGFCQENDIPWLTVTPVSGTVTSAAQSTVQLNVNTTGLQPGTYPSFLHIRNDTPYAPNRVPVTLTVSQPQGWGFLAGTVAGFNRCDTPGGPLAGASVAVRNASGPLGSVTTNGSGFYSYLADPAIGPYSLSVSHGNHISQTVSGLAVSPNMTTTTNFDLRLDAPCLNVAPSFFDVTLEMGGTATRTLTLDNSGAGALTYQISLAPKVAPPAPAAPANASYVPTVAVLNSWPTGLSGTYGIAATVGGDLWVGDGWYVGDRLIHRFTPNGTDTGQVIAYDYGGGWGADMAFDPRHNKLWQTSVWDDNCVYELDPLTRLQTGNQICPAFDTAQQALAFDPLSDTFYSGSSHGAIYQFDRAGAILDRRVLTSTITQMPYGPTGLAFNPSNGHLFVLVNNAMYAGADIVVVDTRNGFAPVSSMWVDGLTPYSRGGLDIDCNGTLWLVDMGDMGTTNRVLSVDSGERGVCSYMVPWLSVDPTGGVVPPSGRGQLTAEFRTSLEGHGLQPGEYYAELAVGYNDYQVGPFKVPVSLTVNAPASYGRIAGLVTGLGPCDSAGRPVLGAQVVVSNASGPLNAMVTGADGRYEFWLDPAAGPFSLAASAQSFVSGARGGLTVTAGGITTADVTLRADAPCASAQPLAFDVALDAGGVITHGLTLSNTGAAGLDYEISIAPMAFAPPPPASAVKQPAKQSSGSAASARRAPSAAQTKRPAAALSATKPTIVSWPTGLNAPWGLGATLKAGLDIWVSSEDGSGDDRDHRFFPDGTPTADSIDANFGGDWAADMAFDGRNGTLWQVNAGGDNCIYELDPAAKVQTGAKICPPFSYAQRGLAYDPISDNFFSGSWYDYVINRFDRSGTLVETFYSGLPVSGLAYNSASGHLLVVSNGPSYAWPDVTVLDVNAGYATVDSFEVAGLGDYEQAGADLDCSGNLWLVNQTTKQVLAVDAGEVGVCNSLVSWLKVHPGAGMVQPGGSAVVDLGFYAAGMQPGAYRAEVVVRHNAAQQWFRIPVTMTVARGTTGRLSGLVTDANTGTPLVGAYVQVHNSSGGSAGWTYTSAGDYSFDLPAGTYTVTVSKTSYQTAAASVTLLAGGAVTRDFALMAGRMHVAPLSIDLNVPAGMTTTVGLSLMNSGGVAAWWALDEYCDGCGSSSDVPWLGEVPNAGTLNGGSMQNVAVTLDARGLAGGTHYTATLRLRSGTPYTPVDVPVRMHVGGGGGTLPFVNFSAAPVNGPAPLLVTFNNQSSNYTQARWDFGDGAISDDPSPTVQHIYAHPGVYGVGLVVSNTTGMVGMYKPSYITVTAEANMPVADFTGNPVSGTPPMTVTFSNLSSNFTYALWDFGDGTSSNNPGASVPHQYLNPGSYSVKLTVSSTLGIDTLVRPNYINLSMPGNVDLVLVPANKQVGVGEVFTAAIEVRAGTQQVDGVGAYLNFDPAVFQVVDSAGNPATEIENATGNPLNTLIQNVVDNATGRIDYSVGKLSGTKPTGTFQIGVIRLKAVAKASFGSEVLFAFDPANNRRTDVTFNIGSVLRSAAGGFYVVSGNTDLLLLPGTATVGVGQTFTVAIQIQSGAQQIDGAAAYLSFDPSVLQVVDAGGISTTQIINPADNLLTTELQNEVDNVNGLINYAVGKLSGAKPSGTYRIGVIRFRAIADYATTTLVSFDFDDPNNRKTDVTYSAQSMLRSTSDGQYTIVNGILNGSVTLQGRESLPPSDAYNIPLSVELIGAGSDYTETVQTDEYGAFTIAGLTPGTYTIRVKNGHTLRNTKLVEITGGANSVGFCTLLEGDANNNNQINILDFSVLATTFGKSSGDTGFDGRADFNESNQINILDFSALATNYGRSGDQPCQ